MNARAKSAVLLVVFSGSLSFAQSRLNGPMSSSAGNGSLTVTVVDSQGHPLKDARVEVHTAGMLSDTYSAYTNSQGVAEINNLAVGAYDATATKNLDQASEHVEIQGLDASVTLRMSPSGDASIGDANTVSVAQYKVPGKARKEFEKAHDALGHRKMDDAVKHLARALEIYPCYSEALMMRGILSMDKEDRTAAASDLEESIKCDASNSTAHFALGATYSAQGKFEDAIRTIQSGLSTAPQSWQGYFELGKAQIGKADYQAAVRSLDRAQMLTKTYPLVHLVKAHALLALKQYDDAMSELQVFLEATPKDDRNSVDARKMLDRVQAFRASK